MSVRCWRGLVGLVFLPALCLTGLSGVPAAPPAGAAWPVFRGNLRQTGVADAALPDRLDVLWQFRTQDSIEGAPAVADGVVFLGSLDENLYAVNLADGSEKWRFKAGPIKASPAVQDGLVYVGNIDGLFHCVDAARGAKRWTFETGGEIVSGATCDGDRVLFGSYDETLYCLGNDGKQRWKFKIQGPVNGSPAVAEGRTFVAGCDSAVHVLEVAGGKEQAAVDLGGQSGATAALAGDRLFVGTMSNEFHGVDWKKGAIAWTFRAGRRAQPFYSSAAVTDSLVLVGSRDKRLYALDRATGKEVWSFATGSRVDSSPVVAGSRVYVGSFDETFYVLDLATGREVQRITLDAPVSGSPAVAGGRLLVGTQKGTLYCFGAKK